MLILTRKVGEKIIISDNIEIVVVELRKKTVRIGITAPLEVRVMRSELLKVEEKLDAQKSGSVKLGSEDQGDFC